MPNRRTSPEASALCQVAQFIAKAAGDRQLAAQLAQARGAPDRVQRLIKAPVAAGSSLNADYAELYDAGVATTAFVESLEGDSILATLLPDANVVPLRTRAALLTVGASAWIVGEGAAVPVGRLALEGGGLEPVCAAGLVVLSTELINASGTAAEALISRELRRAVATTMDAKLIDLAVDGDTPSNVSVGADYVDAIADLRWLLFNVAPRKNSRLLWAMAADVANGGATLTNIGGALIFPDLTPQGGQLLGVPAIVAEALPAGTLQLWDAQGFAFAVEAIQVADYGQGDILLESAPTQNATTPTPTTMLSLWQNGLRATLAKAYFGARRLRANAVAEITACGWALAEAS